MYSFFLSSALFLLSLPFLANAAPVSAAPTLYTQLLNCADDVALTTQCMASSYPMNKGCDTKADAGSTCGMCECISDNGFWQSQLNQYASRIANSPSS
ncbi:hypothetical protein XPA_003314 [Xanthoria parietina]